jgi:predicted RND superfamily exporter protein
LFTGLADRLIAHKRIVPACLLLVAVTCFYGARFLTFSNDYRAFFSGDDPHLLAFDALQDIYTKSDNVIYVVAPGDGDIFSPKNLSTLEWLTAQSWKTPYSIRVDSVTNFQYTHAEGDDLVVGDLVEGAAGYTQADAERARTRAVNEPLLLHRLVSASGHVAAVNVTVQLPGQDPAEEVPEVVAFSRDLATRLRLRDPGLDVYLTGIVFMNNAFDENAMADLRTLTPLMFVMIAVVLAVTLRSVGAMLATFLVIVLSVVSAIGVAGWSGMQITTPLVSAPTMIMTLAVADCVHYLVTYLQTLRKGLDREAAMRESLRVNIQPIFLTSLTTIVGFLSMNFSDSPPFRDLGNLVATGVGFAFVYSILLLPVVSLWLPIPSGRQAATDGRSGMMDRIAVFIIRRHGVLLWGMGILVVLLLCSVPRNELNDQFIEYFDERIEFRRDTDFMFDNLTGLYSISYSLNAETDGGIVDPGYLETLAAFTDWYRGQPEVVQVSSFTDIMKRLNQNLHGDDPAWYRVPGRRDLAAQYLLLYEMSLPFGLDLNGQINVSKSATRFDVYLRNLTSKQALALERRAQRWLEDHAPGSMQTEGASPSIMFSHIATRNIRGMLIGTVVALVLISFILLFALRSIKLGLISIVPNLVPAGMAFGLWGLLVGQVGLALSVVVGMSLGVVVDDTVHFLTKYLRARREGDRDVPDAVRYAFNTVGRALVTTSVVLMAGFLVLTYSPFQLNARMGLVTAMIIGSALLADFLLLPGLLLKLDKGGQAGRMTD